MAKRGAVPLSEAVLLARVTANIGGGFSQADVRTVVKALKQEIIESIQDGNKVTLSGVVTFVPSAKEGRKKGTVVRNPFDQTERKLTKDEPDKFVVKARVSTAVRNGFPAAKTAAGQTLLAQLKPVRKGRK